MTEGTFKATMTAMQKRPDSFAAPALGGRRAPASACAYAYYPAAGAETG